MKHFDMEKMESLYGVSIEELTLLGIYVLDECKSTCEKQRSHSWVRKAIRRGIKAQVESEKSVSFSEAIEENIRAKSHRRPLTIREIRCFMQRFLKVRPEFGNRMMSSFTPLDCQKLIEDAYSTPRQRNKARVLLHGLFSLAWKRGWCRENPVAKVDVQTIHETPIQPLSVEESQELITTAYEPAYRDCLIPISVMLYAGVRPHEIQRLTWENINLEEGILTLTPQQTKTGGARQITIEPILLKLLNDEYEKITYKSNPDVFSEAGHNCSSEVATFFSPKETLCPPKWTQKWREIRLLLGWHPSGNKKKHWTPDILRHTYASYHALYYKDYTKLQYEMGHRSSQLLRTRYLNLSGLTRIHAKNFWQMDL